MSKLDYLSRLSHCDALINLLNNDILLFIIEPNVELTSTQQ